MGLSHSVIWHVSHHLVCLMTPITAATAAAATTAAVIAAAAAAAVGIIAITTMYP